MVSEFRDPNRLVKKLASETRARILRWWATDNKIGTRQATFAEVSRAPQRSKKNVRQRTPGK